MRYLAALLYLGVCTVVAEAGDIPRGDLTFPEFRALWEDAKQDTLAAMGLSGRWEQMLRTKENGLDSNTVFVMAEEGIRPEFHGHLRWVAMRMLSYLQDTRSRLLLKQYLDDADEFVRQRIAINFLHWGEWNVGAPVLAASGEFGVLALNDKDKARSFAEAALQSENMDTRYKAALALASYYHDRQGFDQDYGAYTRKQRFEASRILLGTFGDDSQKARHAAQDFLLSREPEDIKPGRERFDAVRFLEHDAGDEDIPVFMTVIRGDTMPRFGREVIFALRALRELSTGGSKVATDSLTVLYESEWWTKRQETIEDFWNRLGDN